jgi:hypothetical protein
MNENPKKEKESIPRRGGGWLVLVYLMRKILFEITRDKHRHP